MRGLIKPLLGGFGFVFLMSLQTYNIVYRDYLLAGITSIFITACFVSGVQAAMKTTLHKIYYGIGCLVGVEAAIFMKGFIG